MMKKPQKKALTAIWISWLLIAGLIFPCLLVEAGGAGFFPSGAAAERSSPHGHGDASHQPGYCCHDRLVYGRDEAPSAREAIRFIQASSLSAWVPLAGLLNGLSLPNAAEHLPFHLHLLKPPPPDLYLLHSSLLI